MALAFVAFVPQGRLIRGGLGMMVASLLPLFWQVYFTDSESPGFVMLLVFTFPPGLLVLLIGLAMAIVRFWKRSKGEASA
jgi:hypothetical protein